MQDGHGKTGTNSAPGDSRKSTTAASAIQVSASGPFGKRTGSSPAAGGGSESALSTAPLVALGPGVATPLSEWSSLPWRSLSEPSGRRPGSKRTCATRTNRTCAASARRPEPGSRPVEPPGPGRLSAQKAGRRVPSRLSACIAAEARTGLFHRSNSLRWSFHLDRIRLSRPGSPRRDAKTRLSACSAAEARTDRRPRAASPSPWSGGATVAELCTSETGRGSAGAPRAPLAPALSLAGPDSRRLILMKRVPIAVGITWSLAGPHGARPRLPVAAPGSPWPSAPHGGLDERRQTGQLRRSLAHTETLKAGKCENRALKC